MPLPPSLLCNQPTSYSGEGDSLASEDFPAFIDLFLGSRSFLAVGGFDALLEASQCVELLAKTSLNHSTSFNNVVTFPV